MAIKHKQRRKPSLKEIKGDTLKPLVKAYLKRANAHNLGYLRGLRTIEKKWGRQANVEYLTRLLRWLQDDRVRSELSEEVPESTGDLEPVTK